MSTPYRPDIDGLRALAVLSVVVFHANPNVLPGGYLGVDIFFVISGYLITSILINEHARGTYSIVDFYKRRALRILPALFFVLISSFIAAWYLYMPSEMVRFGESSLSALLFVANFFFATQLDYFEGPAELVPLLHTWSLSVEEQFYLVFPFLALALLERANSHLRYALIVGFVGLLLLGNTLTHIDGTFSFFNSIARAWELFFGALLAFEHLKFKHLPNLGPKIQTCLAWLGFILVAFSLGALDKHTKIPGIAGLLPTFGTILLINSGRTHQSPAIRLLRLKPVVFIGLISYSLYLWHWPILSFARYLKLDKLGTSEIFPLLMLSFTLAAISWWFVERPFRSSNAKTVRTRLLCLMLAFLALVGANSIAVFKGTWISRWPKDFIARVEKFDAMTVKYDYYDMYQRGRCFLDYEQTLDDYPAQKCLQLDRDKTNVVIAGDSFAAHYYPGLQELLDGQRYTVSQLTMASCPLASLKGDQRCDEFAKYAPHRYFVGELVDIVILAVNWQRDVPRYGIDLLLSETRKQIQILRDAGKMVVLIGQSPDHHSKVPHKIVRREYLRFLEGADWQSKPQLRLDAEVHRKLNRQLNLLADEVGAQFIDPIYHLCDSDGCLVLHENEPLHWDWGHLTAAGSRLIAKQIIALLEEHALGNRTR